MAYLAANAVVVTADYTPATTFPPQGWFRYPYNRVTAFVNLTDVVCQVLEEPGGWSFDESQELLLREGFNSRDLPDFVAVRFRVWPLTDLQTTGKVDISLLFLH